MAEPADQANEALGPQRRKVTYTTRARKATRAASERSAWTATSTNLHSTCLGSHSRRLASLNGVAIETGKEMQVAIYGRTCRAKDVLGQQRTTDLHNTCSGSRAESLQ